MNEEPATNFVFNTTPFPEDEKNVTLEIISYEENVRKGLPQKKQLEGKITLNPDRCHVLYIPPEEETAEKAVPVVDRTRYDLYLVIIPFNLHEAIGNKHYVEVTFWVEMNDPQHTAFDLCPKNISSKVEVTKTYTISPQIKFQEIEASLGQVNKQLHFEVLRPIITATGEGEHRFYWTYRGYEGNNRVVAEAKQALCIIQVPRGTSTLEGIISCEVVMAQRIGIEWLTKDCQVAPYSFRWQLDQSKRFYAETTTGQRQRSAHPQKQSDVCVVCALAEEAEAFITLVENTCHSTFMRGTDKTKKDYLTTTIQNSKGENLKLHVIWPPRHGPVEMSVYLPTILGELNPRLAIMTGICAGDKRKTSLGDLIVADRTVPYDEGKFTLDKHHQQDFQPDGNIRHTHPQILQAVRMFNGWKQLVSLLGRPLPTCYIAAMASGSAVRSDDPFSQIQRMAARGVIALDMEGAAFYRCVAEFPEMYALLVKGVCDYGDMRKNDAYHQYAASASAAYALAFIKEYVNSDWISGEGKAQ
ncbi:hypothetical protein KDH_12650 [Dictyobacter sp. S3.2.2.5]|uniref:Nucleoside phosphorylase domain-containing protein n=1 Tax=Dictyobacter halimunensis TaxID=3026934 RepID=A0ABQ6FJL8_9CHLR|nr:hypothetical protein KDH_12650 [Dictyobacter sp. S3.2.2.5]